MTKLKIFLLICILICTNLLFSLKSHSEKTEVVFWTVQLAPFSTYISGVIDEFEKLHPYVKVKWIDVPYAEAEKRVLASLLSNNMPDLINITADFNMTLATKGALIPIEKDLNLYGDSILNLLSYDDKVWGVPFYATSAITVYNRELMNEFGYKSPPKTYDELFSQIERSNIKANKYLFMPTLTENDTLYKILNKYNINSPQGLLSNRAVSVFELLQHFYNEQKIPKESITQTHREVLEKYSSGNIAYLQVGANFLNIIKENSLDVYLKTDVAQQFYGEKEVFDFSLMTLAVPLKSKHKNEAIMFAKFLTNPQNQLSFAKITGVLPCNKETLSNEYFNADESLDLIVKARSIGAKQLLKPVHYKQQGKNQKEIITLLNKLVEKVLLEQKSVKTLLEKTSAKWTELILN